MIPPIFPSFLIKIDMFFPESVVSKSHKVCTACNDLPAAVDVGGSFGPPADPTQSPGGGRGDEAIYTKLQFCEFC